MQYKPFEQDEQNLIRAFFPFGGTHICKKLIPYREVADINGYVIDHDIRMLDKAPLWSREYDQYLRDNADIKVIILSVAMQVPKDLIIERMLKLGLEPIDETIVTDDKETEMRKTLDTTDKADDAVTNVTKVPIGVSPTVQDEKPKRKKRKPITVDCDPNQERCKAPEDAVTKKEDKRLLYVQLVDSPNDIEFEKTVFGMLKILNQAEPNDSLVEATTQWILSVMGVNSDK